MTRLNMERAAAERRMKRRGVERVSDSGYTVDLVSRANAGVRSAERFLQEAKRWRPIEDVVEKNRHLPINGGPSRADLDTHMRAILDACED